MHILKDNNDIGLVLTNLEIVDINGIVTGYRNNVLPKTKEKTLKAFFLGKIVNNTPTILVQRSVLDDIGGFPEDLPMKEDHFFLMKVAQKYDIHLIDEHLVCRRIVNESMSHSLEAIKRFDSFKPFIDKSIAEFPLLRRLEKHAYAKLYRSIGLNHWKQGEFKTARKYIVKSWITRPNFIKNGIWLFIILTKTQYSTYQKIRH